LLNLPFGAARDQWRALEEEGARYNIGSIRRTLNVPTFVLLFLVLARHTGQGAREPEVSWLGPNLGGFFFDLCQYPSTFQEGR